ncbi:DUF421 domain-containing protein [Serpentinicella alkaliphila]|uniref:Uncharacterized membrane protein YcaP (DUF421 family) n=1 Tax=Serpentinicella alkaliphila TaxID=1734049 RepID=A0A4R2TF57_9FIRM|nr:DUF421 domain-containing protein [Serpentinicella alkaliphila]QUH25508.1 DUF421 domain-containing protein [Serpentinicella alkaliphila]TCP99694.1 uncharacterized membrane protein YcaP (DUF421 family) [Serpentinicella alkaliphila]
MIITFIRTLTLYFLVVVVMRMMGKRQIAQMQPFELVIAIMIADLAATPMENTGIPLLNGVVPIITLLSVQVIVSFISIKSEVVREIICGKPSILINRGKLVQSELRRLRINMNDLLEQLRGKDYPNLSDVEFAILETNGELSIIPKTSKRTVIVQDLNLKVQQEELPITVIVDGNLLYSNLQKTGRDEKWLHRELKKQGLESIKDTFFAFLSSEGEFFAQKKDLN